MPIRREQFSATAASVAATSGTATSDTFDSGRISKALATARGAAGPVRIRVEGSFNGTDWFVLVADTTAGNPSSSAVFDVPCPYLRAVVSNTHSAIQNITYHIGGYEGV